MELSLELPNVTAQPGEEICLDVSSENFDGIFGLQLTIAFDPRALSFKRIENLNLPDAELSRNFNTETAPQGNISVLWTNFGTPAYAKPFTLFTLCFEVTGASGEVTPVRFANDPVPIEVIASMGNLEEQYAQSLFRNGAVWIGASSLPDLPEIDAAPVVFGCEGVWKSGLDISVAGGAPPYQYQWIGPDDFTSAEEDIPVADFGVYFLTVTDQNQSRSAATVFLRRPLRIGDPPAIIAGATITEATNCNDPDGAVALDLNRDAASLSFEWSNGTTTQNATGLLPGPYEVTVTGERGCMEVWSGSVPNANDFEIAVASQPAVCTQSRGRLEITSPLGDQYQYVWFDASEGLTISDLRPGNYGLTVTDANTGCAKAALPALPASGDIPLTVQTTQPTCDGTPGRIALQLPAELPFTVNWNTGATTTTLNDLSPGNYRVTVTDETAGCVVRELIALREPNVAVDLFTDCRLSDSAPDSVYATAIPSGGVGPYTFSWSNGQTTASDGQSELGAALPAALFVTVTDQEGCEGYSTVTNICREVDETPEFNTSLYYECNDQPFFTAYVRSGGTPPYTFAWSTGMQETAEALSMTPASGGGYTAVTITDAGGRTDILLAPPLPFGACTDQPEPIELIVPDTVVETDEPFSLPIYLQEQVGLETLVFELHWDAERLQLDALTGPGLTLSASIPAIDAAGKALLSYDLSQEETMGAPIAMVQFTPKGDTEALVPVILGYSSAWSAAVGEESLAVIPKQGSVRIVPDGAKVWPGDTDQNGEVDHRDLLPVGLAFNATGTQRPNASLEWFGQYVAAWGTETPESAVDYKHIDADGSGQVNAADTAAIVYNWTQLVDQPRSEDEKSPKANGAPLLVQEETISSDQNNILPILLGTTEQPAENVYGLAFSVTYQGFVSDENFYVDFVDSWLGQDDTPLLTLYRHFPEDNRVDIALVRTNQQPISGSGTIARLILRGNNRTGSLQSATLEPSAVKMIDEQEQLLPVSAGSTSVDVDFSTGIREPAWARSVQVMPVPATDELTVRAEGLAIEQLQILNGWGQTLAVYTDRRVIPVSSLAPGFYWLRIRTSRGVVVRQWVKQ